jgi:flagellar motor switch protein FliM
VERLLSQEEIDELLMAFDDGTIDNRLQIENEHEKAPSLALSKTVSPIDLTRGQNYSKWRIANLDIVFNAFARYFSISLSNSVQMSVSLQKKDIASKFFEQFLNELQDAGLLGVISLEPLKGDGLLVFDKNLCFGLVEMMLGVSAESGLVIPNREVSSIEANIIRSIMSEGCKVLNRAFASLHELSSRISRVETNWKLLNILTPETEMIQVVFHLQAGELQGELRLMIPYFSLEPLKDKLRDEWVQFTERDQHANWAQFLGTALKDMEIPLAAAWGHLSLTIQEILSLGEGDIITIDYDEDSPITVLAAQQPKLKAMPGIRNGKKAVRIVD